MLLKRSSLWSYRLLLLWLCTLVRALLRHLPLAAIAGESGTILSWERML